MMDCLVAEYTGSAEYFNKYFAHFTNISDAHLRVLVEFWVRILCFNISGFMLKQMKFIYFIVEYMFYIFLSKFYFYLRIKCLSYK